MHGKGNQNGKFFTPVQGTMYAIRLVHISGAVGCSSGTSSRWGCRNNDILTIITDENNQVFFPENRNAFPYKIPGFTSDSPELILTFNTPLMVATGQEYRLWFSEDLRDQHEDNNVGPSCTKVLLTMKKKLFTKKVIKWSGKR